MGEGKGDGTYSNSFEERRASLLPRLIAGIPEVMQLYMCRSSCEDRLQQQQAHLSRGAIRCLYGVQESIEIQRRHIRMHVFEERPEERVLESTVGQSQGALGVQKLHVVGREARQGSDIVGQVKRIDHVGQ